METNQVTEEEVKGAEDVENEEARVTSSSDCNKKKSDPVKAFQEDMDMEGLSGGFTSTIGYSDTLGTLGKIVSLCRVSV